MLALTKTGSQSGICLGHIDALVEDVGGGGGGLCEHDRLREGGGVGGADVGRSWLVVVGRAGVRGRVSGLGGRQLRHGMVHAGLLLLDVGGGCRPPARPHAGVGGVSLVLSPRPLQVVVQVTVDVSVI